MNAGQKGQERRVGGGRCFHGPEDFRNSQTVRIGLRNLPDLQKGRLRHRAVQGKVSVWVPLLATSGFWRLALSEVVRTQPERMAMSLSDKC